MTHPCFQLIIRFSNPREKAQHTCFCVPSICPAFLPTRLPHLKATNSSDEMKLQNKAPRSISVGAGLLDGKRPPLHLRCCTWAVSRSL